MTGAIDVHAHWFPPALVERFEQEGAARVWPPHPAGLERRVDEIEEAGLQSQILSLGHNQPTVADEQSAVRAARFANDLYAEAVAGQQRLSAFGSLPLPHVDASLAEAERCLTELGLAGINVGTTALGRSLDDPSYDALWQMLDGAGATIFVHPVGSPDTFTTGMESHLLGPKFGGPHEAGLSVIRMMAADFPTRYPSIKWIIAPMGGTVSLLWRRFEEIGESIGDPGSLGDEGLRRLRSFYYDTTLTDDPAVLRFAVEAFGADRIVLGTDSPRVGVTDWENRMRAGLGLDAGAFEAVTHGTAASLLG